MLKYFVNLFSLRSGKWPAVRNRYLVENNRCIACGTQKRLQVHHIQPVHMNGRELDETNLCTLCKTCHFVFGHLHNWSKCNPNVLHDAKEHLKRVEENTFDPEEKKSLWKQLVNKILLQ